jgi:uncharacterized SAM-binding protein YcdF (DUF218 family)
MEHLYAVLKSFVDPVFIIFILLIISFLMCVIGNKKKGGALLLFLAIVLLYGASIAPVSKYLTYKLEKDYISSRPVEDKIILDVIVALSGGVYEIRALNKTFLSDETTVRLVHAVQMYKKYNAKYLVCSGKDEGRISGAELMAQTAEVLGVPKERIRVEAKSGNTYEHAVEFNKMFINKDMKIGLVTSAYHMKRSEKEFKKYFGTVLPLPSGYWYSSAENGSPIIKYIPQSQWLSSNTVVIREFVGQLWYSIKDI